MRKACYFLFMMSLFLSLQCEQKGQPVKLIEGNNPCRIVLDLGSFKDAQSAVAAWGHMDDPGRNQADAVIGTQAFAALELADYLHKMTGQEIAIQDDDAPAQGVIIFVGIPQKTSAFPEIFKRCTKSWKKVKSKNMQGFRIDTFVDEKISGVLLSGRSSVGTLYAVYDFLERLGVRWFAPGPGNDYAPKTNEINVPALSLYYESPFKIRGLQNAYAAGAGPALVSADFIQWMARNRLNCIWQNAGTRQDLGKYGILRQCGEKQDTESMVSPVCVSNEQLMNNFYQDILAKLETGDWSVADVYNFWAPDPARLCDCPSCQKIGNSADKILYMHYALGDMISKAMQSGRLKRQVMVLTHIDCENMTRPSGPTPKKFDVENNAIVLVPGERCYNHAIDDTACVEINRSYFQTIGLWTGKSCPYKGKVFVTEQYQADRLQDMPVVFSNVLAGDMPAYQKLHVAGMAFRHVRTDHLGVHALLNYQFAQMTWNPQFNLNDITQAYFQFNYQNVAKLMGDYYSKLEEGLGNIMAWRYELHDRIVDAVINAKPAPILPLQKFKSHFTIDERPRVRNHGTNWEKTYVDIFEARTFLEDALLSEIPQQVADRILPLEDQRRYAELTIQLYDNIIRILTLGDDEADMREEAMLRLPDVVNELAKMEIESPALGISNGLEASGLQEVVQKLSQK
jgi:hypothetical protein